MTTRQQSREKARERVFQYIRKHPGQSGRDIVESLGNTDKYRDALQDLSLSGRIEWQEFNIGSFLKEKRSFGGWFTAELAEKIAKKVQEVMAQ